MNPPTEPGVPPPYEDRKTGLVVFGIMTLLLGGLCALFVPLVFFSQAMAAKAGGGNAQPSMLPAAMVYGLLAVVLVWLGIGSIMARRWARALLLIFSWTWLIIGLISIGMMAVMLPQIVDATKTSEQPGQPPAIIFMLIPMVFLGIFFVIVPGVWVYFYRSRHVKATCEALDPVERWTDRSPLPVIAVCLWLAFSVPMMLIMAGAYGSVIPLFGSFVTGPAGSAIYVFLAALWGYSAWSLYRLEWRGWWIVVVSMSVFGVSAFITYSRHDISELYTLMGYPAEQIAQIQKFSFLKGQNMAWASVAGMIPFLGYLFYLRKFLRAS